MIVYKTINKINGKIYIGQDSHNNPKYLGSGVVLNNAIKKYGKENFTKEILQECNSIKELNEAEIYWIKTFNSQNKDIGYSITSGGNGVGSIRLGIKHTEKTKIKMSKAHKGQQFTEKQKENCKVALLKMYAENPHIKTKISNRMKKIYSDIDVKNKRYNNPDYLKRMSDSMKKTMSTPEWKERQSKIMKKRMSNVDIRNKISNTLKGHIPPNKGKKFNKETKHYE